MYEVTFETVRFPFIASTKPRNSGSGWNLQKKSSHKHKIEQLETFLHFHSSNERQLRINIDFHSCNFHLNLTKCECELFSQAFTLDLINLRIYILFYAFH